MPPQAASAIGRLRGFVGCDESRLAWLHELTREVFKLTLVLARIATELAATDARPLLASIHQLDHGIVELRQAFLLHMEGSASASSPQQRYSGSPELEEALEQLNEMIGRSIQTALGVVSDESQYEMLVDGASQVRRSIGA